ncbi:MAG: LuxR C-terminal-related transcriptional regulator [Thermomicrobiales bacterium]
MSRPVRLQTPKPVAGDEEPDPEPPAPTLPLVPLIGRDQDVAHILDVLVRDHTQLVTLLGPGGVGKTRLAMHVAARIEREILASLPTQGPPSDDLPPVLVVPLAAMTVPAHVMLALARQAGVGIDDEAEVPHRIIERITAADHRVLAVLDNAEQVLDGVAALAPIVRACPNLTVLVTSRTVLRLSMEQVIVVEPLPVQAGEAHPDAPSPAAQLFIARARAVHPGFQETEAARMAVEDICARLDGLPLAIELAAARSRFFTPPVLRARIEASSQALGDGPRDAPARHRSLRDLIAWSHALLDSPAQVLFRRLSAFADSVAFSTLGDVTAALDGPDHPHSLSIEETLSHLLDHSLVRIETAADGEPRVTMLRTIRDAGREMLAASGEEAATRAVITRHYQTLVASLTTSTPVFGGLAHPEVTQRLHGDRPNLIAAVASLVEAGAMADAVAMVSGLAHYWLEAGQLREGRGWIERTLPFAVVASPQHVLPMYRVVTILAFDLFDYDAAERYALEALEIERRGGNAAMIAYRQVMLGSIRFWKGERAAGLALQAAGIAELEALGAPFHAALAKASHGECLLATGDLDAAEPLLEDAWATIAARNPALAGVHASALGTVAHLRGDHARAGTLFAESLAYHLQPPIRLQRNLIDRFLRIGAFAASRGDPIAQARMAGSAAAVQDRLILGEIARQQDNYREAMAIRDVLGEDRFQAAWQAGHARDLEASLRDALAIARQGSASPVVIPSLPPPPPAPASTPAAAPPAATTGPGLVDSAGLERLTPREREVLILIASGATNAEIADQLNLSARTVGTHLTRIYAKLAIDNRAEAAVLAIRAGLIHPHRSS